MSRNKLPEKLLTGVESIDSQHLTLFSTIEKVLGTLTKKDDLVEARNLINFLSTYTNIHFESEEQEMIHGNYPDYEMHRHEHELFRKRIEKLEQMSRVSSQKSEVVVTL